MAKKRSASSARGKQVAKSAKHMKDSAIDFSDIPESTDAELKKAKRVGRPSSNNPKQMIAFRIEPKLLRELKKLASKKDKPYQSLIHEILEKAIKRAS